MPQVDQIQIGSTTYDILQSSDATFTGTSNDTTDASATSWTEVEKLASSETNGSIFTKLSSMFKNIRYLYSKIGNIDIGEAGTSISDAIEHLYTNKADINHTHDSSTMIAPDGSALISNTQIADSNHVPSSLLVKIMNDTLTAIAEERSSYVTSLSISNNSTITLFHGNTSVSTATLTTATTAVNGLLPKLANTTAKCLLGDGSWGQAGSTYANVSTAAPGLMPKLPNNANQYINGTGNWTVPPNTTYAFSNKAATLAWNTTSTIATVGGTNITVKMPANPNTNTTYGTNVGCYGTLSGTTLTLNERNFRV